MAYLHENGRYWGVLGGIFLISVLLVQGVSAQGVGDFFSEGGLSLNPQHPEPHEEVVVSLNYYGIDLFGSTILWYKDDALQHDATNQRSFSFTAGSIGEKTTLRAVVTLREGKVLSVTRVVSPALVDLIIESDTYVPPFYKGRSLPSREADMRAIAVVHDGSGVADSTYTYKWSLSNSVLFGGPVGGKNVAELTIPRYDNKRLTVEVFDEDGSPVAKNSVVLRTQEPELHFYELNPLRGLGQKALGSQYVLLGEESTISGEPYYLSPDDLDEVNVSWKLDGQSANSVEGRPNQLTLERVGEGSVRARVGLEIITNALLPQFVRGALDLVFN